MGIGTVGLAAEWGWSHVFMPLPWPSALFPEGALLGFAMAVAGALIGGWAAGRLASDDIARVPLLRPAAVAAAAVVAVLTVFALYKPALQGASAKVALTEVTTAPKRTVNADVRLNPASAGDGAEWLTVTAWQGGGLVVNRLKKIGAGHYRTTQAIPVHGDWKALDPPAQGQHAQRAADLPARGLRDPGQGGPGHARASRGRSPPTTRSCSASRRAPSGGLWAIAYALVAAIALALLALLAWGLHRLARSSRLSGGGEPPAQRTEARRTTTPTPATS